MSTGIPLGPYLLLRRLATGGMAEIFAARREGPEGFSKDLVVKRILPHLAESPRFTTMFLGEARIAARLDHPHIVQVYDFGQVDGQYYLAMEFVRGVDLRALINRASEVSVRERRAGALPPHVAASVMAMVCEGLAHAHSLSIDGQSVGLVHRDVTPSNILLSFEGAVKVADFGIVKSDLDETQHGVVKGKYTYMSPEQVRGEPLDARSDLFNVGIVLFESVMGQMLFPPDDVQAVKVMSAQGKIPNAHRLDFLPEGLQQVVRRSLMPSAGDRYPNALALRADLLAFLRQSGHAADQVELGSYVRSLFPDVLTFNAPRAAGTVPATVAEAGEHDYEQEDLLEPTADDRAPRQSPRPDGAAAPGGLAGSPTAVLPRRAQEADAAGATPRKFRMGIGLIALFLGALCAVVVAVVIWPETENELAVLPVETADANPARENSELRVTTEPTGLPVAVDGVVRGIAPLALTLRAPASYRVEVMNGEQVAAAERVELLPGEAFELALTAHIERRGTLRVTTTPESASVSVDGDEVGESPVDVALLPGNYQLSVAREGHSTQMSTVEIVTPGETVTVRFVLVPEAGPSRPTTMGPSGEGFLIISTQPWSDVFLRGRRLGTTPLRARVPAGRHSLELRHPGQPSRRRTVLIRNGEETRVSVAL